MKKSFRIISFLLTAAMLLMMATAITALADTPTVDGVKDAAYTNDKMTVFSTAYAGSGGAAIDNTNGVYTLSWYTWDDTSVYYYCEVYDPNSVSQMDVFYLLSDVSTSGTNAFQEATGAYFIYTLATKATDGAGALSPECKYQVTATGRSYEFKFARTASTVGFSISPVIYVSASYTVSYKTNYYLSSELKQVKYDDNTTWKDMTATDAKVIAFDGVKDTAYTDDKMTICTAAFSGPGGSKITNTNGVYSRNWYLWDSSYVYYYCDIYDPSVLSTMDVFYLVSDILTDGTPAFQSSAGCYFIYHTDTKTTESAGALAFQCQYSVTSTGRSYEFKFPRTASTLGFSISPVLYLNAAYTVNYSTNYYSGNELKQVKYDDSSTWRDETSVDPSVVYAPEKITAVEDLIKLIPEDTSTLTLANRDVVDNAKAARNALPAGWAASIDSALAARLDAAIAKITELDIAAHDELIKPVEDLITALPDTITLYQEDAVNAAWTAYENLGDLKGGVSSTLLDKLTKAHQTVTDLHASVIVDGQLDDIYKSGKKYSLEDSYPMTSASDPCENTQNVTGTLYTMTDANYIYLYIDINDPQITFKPDGEALNSSSDLFTYETLIVYIDPDPSDNPVGVPYQDAAAATGHNLCLNMSANGRMYLNDLPLRNQAFAQDSSYFHPFLKGNATDGYTGYGLEMKWDRVAGEENFTTDVLFSNITYTGTGADRVRSDEDTYMVALGHEWWANYLMHEALFFADYPVLPTHVDVDKLINALPAADTMTDTSAKAAIETARKQYDLLTPLNAALISADTLKHLTDCEDKLKSIPTIKPGDVDGNGVVNTTDALLALRAAVGKITLSADAQKAADVDGNTGITTTDALLILRKAVGKITAFPIEK